MRELSFGPLFVTVVFVCSFLPSHAEVRNEKAQQVGEDPRTFVVRYKNGDQTIPVTVVLDYKKQTEYVINMNPRTPAKSVTLYDFKQRTIAYKDLTNRECFLGRLTYETLNEETDALNKVQNPVDHTPKVLSLDPHRSALTPTEIRNIAGQRTAVFCRKMNTWLIMPQDSHSIQKRETDEVEERTYHRHGFHTVRYSHYGRETRRRFRNSRRNDSKQLSYENKNTSNSTNPKHEISETNSFLGENAPHQPLYHQQHHSQGIEESPVPSSDSFPQENVPSIYEKNSSLANIPDRVSVPNEQFPFGSDLEHNAGLQHRISERTLDQNRHLPFTENKPFSTGHANTLYGRKMSNASENVDGIKHGEQSSAPYARSPVFTEDTLESKIYPETSDSSSHNQGTEEFIYTPDRNDYDSPPVIQRNPSLTGNKQSQIETEWSANETSHQFIPERAFPKLTDNHDIPEDSDVSTNVLEIPKNSKKFENLDRNQGPQVLIPQTNEDVHDVFEGFYNLKDNHSPTNPNYFHNSHFIPPEIDQERDLVHPETYPVKYFPTLPHSKENNVTNNNVYWRGNPLPYTITDVTTTDSLLFTTFTYGDNRRATSPTPLVDSNGIASRLKYSAHSSEKSIPYHEQTINSYERPPAPSEQIYPGHQLESSSNTVPFNYFTTEPPTNVQNNYVGIRHRSDIPSEIDHGENVGYNALTKVEEDAQNRTNRSRLIHTEVVREGVSPQQVRFQNALRNYKPDEIVINVEGIPTQRPPESIAGFQDRAVARNEIFSRKPTPSLPLPTGKRSEQVSGGTWRSTYPPNVRNPSRRINTNIPRHYPDTRTFRQRQSFVSQQHRQGINEFPHHPVNNFPRRVHTQTHNDPNQPHYSRTFEQPHYPLDALPPGVSIHPRHPNAPYADMFHSNMPPSLNQESNFRTVKPHRQRHHRKKNRLTNCCRGSGKASGNLSSCCRNGGSCCSGHLGKTIPSRTSCCSSAKSNRGQFHPSRRNPTALTNKAQEIRTRDDTQNRQLYTLYKSNENKAPSHQDQRTLGDNRDVKDFSSRQNRMLVPNDSPQPQPRKTFEDNRERCLKEKMCRTVYESTQQVIVCRNANIVGCS